MPRTVEEILQHADELATRFEFNEPNPTDELDARAVTLLRAAVAERSEAERHLLEAVRKAREGGLAWSAIGSFVGTTGEAPRHLNTPTRSPGRPAVAPPCPDPSRASGSTYQRVSCGAATITHP